MDLAPILLLLADDAAPNAGPLGPFMQFVPLLVIMGLFYVIILLPQQKERKRQSELQTLKKDDEVIILNGLFGKVVSVSPDSVKVVLRIDENVRITVHRNAINSIVPRGDDAAEKG